MIKIKLRKVDEYMANYEINISAQVDVNENVIMLIDKCAKATLAKLEVPFDCFADVEIVDNETIKEINTEFRNKDSATDVLSFPMHDFYNAKAPDDIMDEKDPETGMIMLGDMVISYEKAIVQAEEFGHTVDRECGYLTVHSILHLLGFDHEQDSEDEKLMRDTEEEILEELKLFR